MKETKRNYEQYCTHLKRNIIMEETVKENGETKICCTEADCEATWKNCRNKLRQKSR